jgi:hypothetical protein
MERCTRIVPSLTGVAAIALFPALLYISGFIGSSPETLGFLLIFQLDAGPG